MRMAFAFSAALLFAGCASAPERSATVEVRVLALNDFHGNLEPPADGIRVVDQTGAQVRIPGGGAARLATLVAQRRVVSPNTILVAAGPDTRCSISKRTLIADAGRRAYTPAPLEEANEGA